MTNGFGEPFKDVPPADTPHAEPDLFGDGPEYLQQEKASNRRWTKIVVGSVLGIFALIALGAFLLFSATRGPIDEANNFLAEVRLKDYPAAYARTEPSCIGVDQPTFTETMSAIEITSYNLRQTNVQSSSGQPTTGTAGGEITLANGDRQPITVFLTKFEDEWKVCGFGIGE